LKYKEEDHRETEQCHDHGAVVCVGSLLNELVVLPQTKGCRVSRAGGGGVLLATHRRRQWPPSAMARPDEIHIRGLIDSRVGVKLW
jgi:hypothetical protein